MKIVVAILPNEKNLGDVCCDGLKWSSCDCIGLDSGKAADGAIVTECCKDDDDDDDEGGGKSVWISKDCSPVI